MVMVVFGLMCMCVIEWVTEWVSVFRRLWPTVADYLLFVTSLCFTFGLRKHFLCSCLFASCSSSVNVFVCAFESTDFSFCHEISLCSRPWLFGSLKWMNAYVFGSNNNNNGNSIHNITTFIYNFQSLIGDPSRRKGKSKEWKIKSMNRSFSLFLAQTSGFNFFTCPYLCRYRSHTISTTTSEKNRCCFSVNVLEWLKHVSESQKFRSIEYSIWYLWGISSIFLSSQTGEWKLKGKNILTHSRTPVDSTSTHNWHGCYGKALLATRFFVHSGYKQQHSNERKCDQLFFMNWNLLQNFFLRFYINDQTIFRSCSMLWWILRANQHSNITIYGCQYRSKTNEQQSYDK